MQYLIRNDQYFMILANMCHRKAYSQFYSKVEGFKILDNGAAEGSLVPTDQLLEWAWALEADEVVAPDEYASSMGTIAAMRRFMPLAIQFKVMTVLQSNSWQEFDYILKESIQLGASALALPRVMCTNLGPNARMEAASLARRECSLPIHCLGSTLRIEEAKDLARQGIVRGIDSSAPVGQGIKGLTVHESYTSRPDHFFEKEEVTPLIEENLDQYRSWCTTAPIS